MKSKGKSESVKVAVRVRPMNKREKEENSVVCVEISPNSISVTSTKNETKTFQFDYVFAMESTQREVYDAVAFPIVEGIFEGYNGTVFAYGQTGCGKTFTMMGDIKQENLKGIIPLSFSHIFGYIAAEGTRKKFLVRCSFVEIYNEEVRDLLSGNSKQLNVREDPKKGTYVQDLSYHFLTNSQEIIACLEKGNENRHVGATSMNAKSSRSHSLFTVYLEIQEGEGSTNQKIRTGKLNLVDLAGSERVSKTNATGQTFDEGKKINLSLTALGSVIDALSSNRKHIPYKDSKLTRLLSDSLGGNSRTVMFANVSPASFNYEETLGTLRYASRAKLIKNAPKINEDPKDALLRKYEEEIKLLKQQLEGGGVPAPIISGNNNDNGTSTNIKEVVVTKEMDSQERQELLAKIAALEKGVIDGGAEKNNESEKLDAQALKEREEEIERQKQQFHEYRAEQLKKQEEMDERYEKLREEKIKEEESLNNDINKLKKRVKAYKNEIEDLKLENEKDRIDFLENIKDTAKDVALYKGIVDFMLSNVEVRKIIDLSKYDDVNQKWKIQPFFFKDKKIAFPNIIQPKVRDFIDANLEKRDMIIGNKEDDMDSELVFNKTQRRKINLNDGYDEDKQNVRKKINPRKNKIDINADNANLAPIEGPKRYNVIFENYGDDTENINNKSNHFRKSSQKDLNSANESGLSGLDEYKNENQKKKLLDISGKKFKVSNEVLNLNNKGNEPVPNQYNLLVNVGNFQSNNNINNNLLKINPNPSNNLKLPAINLGPPRERYDEQRKETSQMPTNSMAFKKSGKFLLNPIKGEGNTKGKRNSILKPK